MTDFSSSLEEDFVSNSQPPLAKKARGEISRPIEGRLTMLDRELVSHCFWDCSSQTEGELPSAGGEPLFWQFG